MFNDFDFSTLRLDLLVKYPTYTLPRTYHLAVPGKECAFKPPGHPAYFVRQVYNKAGNTTRTTPLVIMHPDGTLYQMNGVRSWTVFYQPVAVKSLRFVLWEWHCYHFWKGCYYDVSAENQIYIPGNRPREKHYRSHEDGRSYSVNGKAIRTYEEERKAHLDVTRPENLYAVRYMQKYYPAYVYNPRCEQYLSTNVVWADGVSYQVEMNNCWWERFAEPCMVGVDGLPVGCK